MWLTMRRQMTDYFKRKNLFFRFETNGILRNTFRPVPFDTIHFRNLKVVNKNCKQSPFNISKSVKNIQKKDPSAWMERLRDENKHIYR